MYEVRNVCYDVYFIFKNTGHTYKNKKKLFFYVAIGEIGLLPGLSTVLPSFVCSDSIRFP